MDEVQHRVYASLEELLSKTKTGDVERSTHIFRLPYNGKANIKFHDMKCFWELYCNEVRKGTFISISERVINQEIPVLVDIDFKYKDEGELNRNYTQKILKNIVAIYQDIIRETLIVENEKELLAVVMEKDEPEYKNGKPSDGIHIIFPDCIVDMDIQNDIIRPKVLEKIRETNILEDLELQNDIEDVFDKNVPRAGLAWVMYGSKKDPDSKQKYKVTMLVDSKLRTCQLSDVLSRNDFGKWHEIIDDENFFNKYDLDYYLPMWLSIQGRQGFMKRKVKTQEQIEGFTIIKKINKRKKQLEYTSLDPVDMNQQLEDAEKLLGMLTTKHCEDYITWVRTGIIMYNISQGRDNGLILWKNWSKKGSTYTEGACESKWNTFEGLTNWSIGTLRWWAKAQNPLKFKAWNESKLQYFIEQAESGSHYDLAILLRKLFSDKYICASITNNLWFEFRDHRWYPIEKGYKLSEKMSTDLVKLMNKRRKHYSESTDGTDEFAERKMKILSKIIQDLKQANFKRNVLEECKNLFYDENFLRKLDENKNLMCFKNGILDMSSVPVTFRDGTPDDFISKTTKTLFPTYLDADSDEVIEAKKFIEKIFVNPRIRKFFMKTFAGGMRGGNVYKIFPMLQGGGNNAKSILCSLMTKMWGEYVGTLNISIATGKRTASSAATPDIETLKGVRFLFIQEPGPDESFNLGVVKNLTGNDALYSRGMYDKKPQIIEPQFIMVLYCNDLPDTKNSQDQAFFNRSRVIKCESTFCTITDSKYHEIPHSEEEQFKQKLFKADPLIREKFDDILIPGLLWLFKQELNDFLTHGVEPPPEVLEATEIYQQSNDVFKQFYDENFKETDSEDDEVTLPQAFMIFKSWFAEAFPGKRMPSRNDLHKNMEKKYGKMTNYKWLHLTTSSTSDE